MVAAARQEGKLALQTLPGTGFRHLADAFEQAFPGIAISHNAASASTWAPKALQERKASVYEWDVAQIPTITGFSVQPEGMFDPIRGVIFIPTPPNSISTGSSPNRARRCSSRRSEQTAAVWTYPLQTRRHPRRRVLKSGT